MATSIHVDWVKSVVSVGGETKYRLATTCSTPVGITSAKIIFFQEASPSDIYVHICTVGDMLYYSEHNPPVVPPDNPGYFRAATVTQDFDTPQAAMNEETLQRARIQNLMTDWEAGYGGYPGTDSETISNG